MGFRVGLARLALVAAALALGACEGSWLGPAPKPKLPGERISVMTTERTIEPDPRLASLAVRVPLPDVNNDWPQPGGTPTHVGGHVAMASFKRLWRVDVGDGTDGSGRIIAAPIVADGRVYVMDARSRVTALDGEKGTQVWRFDTRDPEARSTPTGGGLAFDAGRVYVTTGAAQVIALEAATGKEIWRTTLSAPMRAGPTVGGGRVFAITIDNQAHALDADTGEKQWSHTGIAETAGLYGTSSPALSGTTAVVAFSSGEVFALRAENGRVLWADSLAGVIRSDAVSSLADVRGLPVIDRGQVIAVSHGGRMVAIDLRSGERVWENPLSSIATPWVAGDFIFVTTVDSELVCLSRRDGRVRWVQPLQRYRDEKDQRGRIIWTGPILTSDYIFVANSLGEGLIVAYQNGELLETVSLPGPVVVTPVVAAGTMYVLTEDADLVALR